MPKLNIINSSMRYLLFLTILLLGFSTKMLAQETETETAAPPASESTTESTKFDSVFSIDGGKNLMQEAEQAIDAQQYELAAEKLQSARQVFNQLSNFYLQLYNSFSGIDNAAAESHRKKALDTSVERDRATYQLALVHRAQNQPELSIPLLVQIVTSQSPGIGLGKKAYEQLLEIGFVDTPYTPPSSNTQPPADDRPQTPEVQPPDGQPQTPEIQPPANTLPQTPEVQPPIPAPETFE